MAPVTALTVVLLTIALDKKLVDLLINLVPVYMAAPVKLLASLAFGIGMSLVIRVSDFGPSVAINETMNLAAVNVWTAAIFGLFIGAGASGVNDFQAAFDNTRNSLQVPVTVATPPNPAPTQTVTTTTPA